MNIALTFWQVLAICLAVTVAIGSIALRTIVKHYLPGYLAEKGKNLADKEDIKRITEIVEEDDHPDRQDSFDHSWAAMNWIASTRILARPSRR